MRIASQLLQRHRRANLLAFGFLILYLAMIPLNAVLETERSEVFPFFDWKLFAYIPDWQVTEFALVVDAIDGELIEEPHYLVPNTDVRDWKAVRTVALGCKRDDLCDEEVNEVLLPIIRESLSGRDINFSLIEATIDLSDIRDNIEELANGSAIHTEYFRPVRTIGQWNTETGRIGVPTETE